MPYIPHYCDDLFCSNSMLHIIFYLLGTTRDVTILFKISFLKGRGIVRKSLNVAKNNLFNVFKMPVSHCKVVGPHPCYLCLYNRKGYLSH